MMISKPMWQLITLLIYRERDATTCEKLKRLYHELQLREEREMVLTELEGRKKTLSYIDKNISALEDAIIGLSDNTPATEALLAALAEDYDLKAKILYRVTPEQKEEVE